MGVGQPSTGPIVLYALPNLTLNGQSMSWWVRECQRSQDPASTRGLLVANHIDKLSEMV